MNLVDSDEDIVALKLQRTEQLISKFKSALQKERMPASQAARSIIDHCNETEDVLVPSVWRAAAENNRFRTGALRKGLVLCCALV